MSTSRRETTIALFCAMGAMLCFSSVPVFLRHLTGYLDSWTTNAVRYGTSAAFWLPFVIVLSRRQGRRGAPGAPAGPVRPRRSIWLAALIPFVPNVLGQIGWATAPYFLKAATIGFGIRATFVFTTLLGFAFIPAERPLARSGWFYLGAAASLGGVFLMFSHQLAASGPADGSEAVGLVILLATALGYSTYVVCVGRFLADYPIRLAFGVVCLYTGVSLVVLMLLFGDWGRLAALGAREWALLIVSGFVGIAFGHVMNYRAIHVIGPVITSGVTLAGPFSTYVLAAAFLGERLTGLQLLGGLIVVTGGFLLIRAKAGLAAKILVVPPRPS